MLDEEPGAEFRFNSERLRVGPWTLDLGHCTLNLAWPTGVLTLHSQPHKIPFPPEIIQSNDYQEVNQ